MKSPYQEWATSFWPVDQWGYVTPPQKKLQVIANPIDYLPEPKSK